MTAALQLAMRRTLPPAGNRRRRGGSTYILVLGMATILTVVGLSTLNIIRLNTRATAEINDWSEAQALAAAGVEHALATVAATSNWRTEFEGQTVGHTLGRGAFEWYLADEIDGNLGNYVEDPFVIVATGQVGDATYKVKARAFVSGQPLAALNSAVHADGEVHVKKRGRRAEGRSRLRGLRAVRGRKRGQ